MLLFLWSQNIGLIFFKYEKVDLEKKVNGLRNIFTTCSIYLNYVFF